MSLLSKLYNSWFNLLSVNYFHILTKMRIHQIGKGFTGDILDIGCGDKPYIKKFPNCKSYRGTNSSDYYKGNTPLGTDVVCDDGCNVPFESETLDHVLNFQVLPVFENMDKFFQEVNRLLKPGGDFLITSDFLYPMWNAPFNFWRTTNYGLIKLAERNGFEVVLQANYGGLWNTLARIIPRYLRAQLYNFISAFKLEKFFFLKILKLIRLLIWLPLIPFLPVLGNFLILIFAFLEILNKDPDFSTNYLLLMKKIK